MLDRSKSSLSAIAQGDFWQWIHPSEAKHLHDELTADAKNVDANASPPQVA